jgi:muconolactone delta-isomerase
MNHTYQFMVNGTVAESLLEELHKLLPIQEAVVEQYLTEGKLINYALSVEEGKSWAIFNANSEMEVMEMLIDFPLTEFMQVEISLLTVYHALQQPAPNFSLN